MVALLKDAIEHIISACTLAGIGNVVIGDAEADV